MEKKQTAVEWLETQLRRRQSIIDSEPDGLVKQTMCDNLFLDVFDQAKAMEKEQIMEAARKCHFEGVRQSAKTSEGYIEYGNQYYTKTYESK